MIKKSKNKYIIPKEWKDVNKKPVSCFEKIKILNENILEINQLTEDAIEDAILMGVDPKQIISVLKKVLSKKS